MGPNFFGPWAEKLVDLVPPVPGERVLDVATGRGAVLLRAAERGGRTGHATGIDLAEGMVAALTADVERLALPHVDVQLMDAERLDFPNGAFDCVLCGFGLMFFPDPEAALAGFRRVLRPGGRLGLSFIPADGLRDARWSWRRDVLRELGVKPPPPNPAEPQDEDALRALVEGTGLGDVSVDHDQMELRFSDPEEYWEWTWSHGMRELYEALDATTLERFRSRAFEHLAAQHARGELAQSVRALFLTARRAE